MYFCTGPPRTYAVPPPSHPQQQHAFERFEDVAVAMHPQLRVFARVTALSVAVWSSSVALQHPQYRKRHLVTVPREGIHLDAIRIANGSVNLDGDTASSNTGHVDFPGELRQIFAVWVTNNKLAVVEKGAQSIEFYSFVGLADVEAVARSGGLDLALQPPGSTAVGDATNGVASPSVSLASTLKGEFDESYPLNQGNTKRDMEDTAASMSGIPGSKYLFVGMASGLICVVEVGRDEDASTWFGLPERTKIWKIDVLPHLNAAASKGGDAKEDAVPVMPPPQPSCYSLACASSDPPQTISSLYLVACFEGGKCFIMLISPAVKCIDQLLSLVNTERDASPSCFGRCTAVALNPSGSRLALGWSDGGISLFRLVMKTAVTAPAAASPGAPAVQDPTAPTTTATVVLTLEPIRELSLAPWGYSAEDVGGVTAIAWSFDARTVAVGYELRGFSLFSLDGCRLMSSLPQHNQPRPEASTATATAGSTMKEACAHGVLQLLWTRESTSLIVVPRGEQYESLVSPPPSPTSRHRGEGQTAFDDGEDTLLVTELFEEVPVQLLKEEDGLCLSLSGAPGRCGAWVRSENSFTRRARDGGVGPAEACGQIHGGDLLVGINDNAEIVNLPFEQIVGTIKALPNNTPVTLHFLRLKWDDVFELAAQALSSEDFLNAYDIQLLGDEDLCVREYALRMQVLHGDCDLDTRPPLLEFEKRAKFDGWEAMQGISKQLAQHRYVKLLFALFPVWNPRHALQTIADFGSAVLTQQKHMLRKQRSKEREQRRQLVSMRRKSALSFVKFDFARSVPLSGGKTSHLVLLENAKLRLVSSPSLDDPCALTSCASWSVPADFEAKCAPLRLVAVSLSGNQIAVAGQRGFCLLNLFTGKWRMFGNVNDEQDMYVHSLLWIKEDTIAVNFTRFSEDHRLLHLQAYPRNHLDEDSILAKLAYPSARIDDVSERNGTKAGVAAAPGSSKTTSTANDTKKTFVFAGDVYKGDCFYSMESGEDESHIFCLSMKELWSFGVTVTGSIRQNDLAVSLELRRTVKLPPRIAGEASVRGYRNQNAVLDFTIIPRFLHVQDEKLKEAQQQKLQAERELEQQETQAAGGWLSSLISMIAGGEVPDQYKPEEVLPRFAFVDEAGDVIVWDPELRSQRVLCSNVSTMARLFVTASAAPSWPTQCRLMYGLYGPEGMKLWLPLLDGVYMTHTQAFEQDDFRLETFLACHDPLRAKTYEIEFGTAPAPAELYEQVVGEYGITLEKFHVPVNAFTGRKQLEDGIRNLRGCIATVDDLSAKDRMLRFDSDVKVLGVQQAFGLLVGISQDVYVPSGVFQPCYDIFSRVQPFFHTLLCYLVQNHQVAWAKQIVHSVRSQFALSTPTQELFLHSMLEACFAFQCSEEAFHAAIQLLQPAMMSQLQSGSSVGGASPEADDGGAAQQQKQQDQSDRVGRTAGDIDEYCEIVAHVARKSEPSRLKLLFPAVGDPLELLAICRERSELRTAANFLLVLEESSSASPSFRKACAAELVAQCIEQEEWNLAQHVVRVARDWEHPDENEDNTSPENVEGVRSIDEQLANFVWNDFVHGEYERVVWSIEELQAKLPPSKARDIEIQNEQEEAIVSERLREVFIETNKLRQLRILLQAVTEARYQTWMRVIKQVMA
ncbi:Wd40 repeat protein [Globisporangium polare]